MEDRRAGGRLIRRPKGSFSVSWRSNLVNRDVITIQKYVSLRYYYNTVLQLQPMQGRLILKKNVRFKKKHKCCNAAKSPFINHCIFVTVDFQKKIV